jgi:hypothetical protein
VRRLERKPVHALGVSSLFHFWGTLASWQGKCRARTCRQRCLCYSPRCQWYDGRC